MLKTAFLRWIFLLLVLAASAGCDRQASRLATEHGMRWARSYDQQLQYLNTAIELDPENTLAYARRGFVRSRIGPYDLAVEDLKRSVELDTAGTYPFETYNGLAWVYATCTEDGIRRGEESVKLATQACKLTNWEDGNIVDTLAAAYAETGDFDEAVHWQEKAIELTNDSLDPLDEETRAGIRQRLHLYLEKKPYRE